MEVNILWAVSLAVFNWRHWLCVCLHRCVCVWERERCAERTSTTAYVSLLTVHLTLQHGLFCYSELWWLIVVITGRQSVWVRARRERCEQRLIAKPFPKALSRSVSWRVLFQRQFVYCWALWQRAALWWRKSVVLCVCVCAYSFVHI